MFKTQLDKKCFLFRENENKKQNKLQSASQTLLPDFIFDFTVFSFFSLFNNLVMILSIFAIISAGSTKC